MLPPLAILAVGVAIVLTGILWLRAHAFVALIAAALTVSLLAPGSAEEKAKRVADAFGATAGGIGISIVLAAIVGACLVESGAADRLVRAALRAFGEQRCDVALAASGFVMAVPVFFDTVFYLLFPLARSTYLRTGKHYLRYVIAMGAGAIVTHSLVPPTPGPLVAAEQFGASVGSVMLAGLAVGVPMAIAGVWFARWIDPRLKLSNPPPAIEATGGWGRSAATPPAAQSEDFLGAPSCRPQPPAATPPTTTEPPFWIAAAPILLPILLIAGAPFLAARLTGEDQASLRGWLLLLADKNFAMLVAAVAAAFGYFRYRRPTRSEAAAVIEAAIASAGTIVLITAAGGAFGGMLKQAGVGEAISGLFAKEQLAGGLAFIWLAFAVSALIKTAQGSSTVAIVTVSGMVASMLDGVELPFHRAYLCCAVGAGALVTCWMNDSGFWIYCKMAGLNEREGLKTWSALTTLSGLVGIAATTVLAAIYPAV